MDTTHSDIPQAPTQDVVLRFPHSGMTAAEAAAFLQGRTTWPAPAAAKFEDCNFDLRGLDYDCVVAGESERGPIRVGIYDEGARVLLGTRRGPDGSAESFLDFKGLYVFGPTRMAEIKSSNAPDGWRPMSSAPAGQLGLCIDIWCAESECRRADCFWHEGRWCYEVFDAQYRVVPVRAPAAWMPAPTKPEGV